MATLLGIQAAYKYALQDLGGKLEEVNGVPPSPANDVRDANIADAINRFSQRVPRTRIVLVESDPTGFYALPLDWQEWSRIVHVESPIDQLPPSYLSDKSIGFQARESLSYYFLYPNPDGQHRLAYTTVHGGGVDNVASISAAHEDIIGKMAAMYAALEYAARYANSVSNNLDAVNYRTKEQEWRAVADALRKDIDSDLRSIEWAVLAATDVDARHRKGWRL